MNYTLLMELVSQIGCHIAVGGGETYRVEETITRMGENKRLEDLRCKN